MKKIRELIYAYEDGIKTTAIVLAIIVPIIFLIVYFFGPHKESGTVEGFEWQCGYGIDEIIDYQGRWDYHGSQADLFSYRKEYRTDMKTTIVDGKTVVTTEHYNYYYYKCWDDSKEYYYNESYNKNEPVSPPNDNMINSFNAENQIDGRTVGDLRINKSRINTIYIVTLRVNNNLVDKQISKADWDRLEYGGRVSYKWNRVNDEIYDIKIK